MIETKTFLDMKIAFTEYARLAKRPNIYGQAPVTGKKKKRKKIQVHLEIFREDGIAARKQYNAFESSPAISKIFSGIADFCGVKTEKK